MSGDDEGDQAATSRRPDAGLWRCAWRGFWPMFGIHLAALAAGFVLIGPATSLVVRQAVRVSGDAALSDTDIASFVLSPGGAIAALVAGTLVLVLHTINLSALLVAARATLRGESFTTIDTFALVAARLVPVARLSLHYLLRALAVIVPFLGAIGLIYFLTLRGNDINYYLTEKPPVFLFALGFSAALLAAMVVLLVNVTITWIHALPLVLFNRVSPHEARRTSIAAASRQRRRIILLLAFCLGLTPLAIAALSAPLSWLALWLSPHLAERLPLLSFSIGLILLLQAAVALLVGFYGLELFALQSIRLFRAAALDTGPPTPTGRLLRLPRSRWAIGLGLTLLVGLAALGTYRGFDQLRMPDDAVIIAHRGASGQAPENTMAAIEAAIDAGADWIEIDVQESADGEVVVFHDSDFKRLGGRDLKIWDATRADLDEIDIGSWFDAGFSGERTPTLAAVLEACRGRARVLIELKYYGHEENLEQRVIDLVEAAGMADQVAVMSLKYAAIRKFRELRPGWKLGLLSSVAVGDLTALQVDFLGLNARAARPGLIDRAAAAGVQVHVWTINDAVTMSAMLSRGVDGLITDEPALAAKVLEQRAGLNPAERLLINLAAAFGTPPSLPEQ